MRRAAPIGRCSSIVTVDGDDAALGRRHLLQNQRHLLPPSDGDDEGLGRSPSSSEPQPLLRATRLRLSLGALDLDATAEAAAAAARLFVVATADAEKPLRKKGEEEERSKASPASSSILPSLPPPSLHLLAFPLPRFFRAQSLVRLRHFFVSRREERRGGHEI